MSSHAGNQSRIQGTVMPGFESVKQVYENELQTMAEKNTQLCVYYKGERVVDLWASATDDPEFSSDSIVNIFSSGKSLEAIAIASLVSQGLLEYKAKIADYWPEFGANGKGDLTVADLMRHEGGMAAFNTSIDPEDLLTENIKQNRIGKLIEGHPLKFRNGNGSKREYHAITRGWIVNELFRRVDPKCRTVGEYLREEISDPLEVDAIIGVKEDELSRISKVWALGFLFQFLQSLKPKVLGRKIKHSFFQILGRLLRVLPSIRNATTRSAPAPYKGMKEIAFFNEPIVARGETPSAAANCSARALAKIAAMMSAKGIWAEREYLSQSAWNAMHEDPIEADMGFSTSNFTQGGVNLFIEADANSTELHRAFNVGREGFYGWMGLGGSLFQWHPRHEIGFGFVPTSLHVVDILNERGKVYQAEVLRCVERLSK
ncbi:MAG TPA: class A beta-lactamase-related serine hydrolase [Myxococcales bacterium]|nr:class A beta-lactamase-related serine hydrolase [Myxococcales bacterium]HIK86030.1 class A beta-lactamase-related serine hydrolase [Myxococcales bacterium]